MTAFLDLLVDEARTRVDTDRTRVDTDDLRRSLGDDPPPSFTRALQVPGVAVIAEVKRASPSRGDLAPDLDAVEHAGHYVRAEVAGISVLTEPDRFKGSLADLEAVSSLGTPTLRKDFTVDVHQVVQARVAGASAVLLIVAALTDDELGTFAASARDLDLACLVEVHDERELARALAIEPAVIGVNARDLRTFEVDRGAFGRLRPAIPDDVVAVAESGVRGPADVAAAASAGADAVLVGESLVTAEDPATAAADLVRAGRAAASTRPDRRW